MPILDANVLFKAPARNSRMDAQLVTSTPRFADDNKSAIDEETDLLTPNTPHVVAHIWHSYSLDYISPELPSSRSSQNLLYNSGPWPTSRYSPLVQERLPDIPQDRQDTEPLRNYTLVTSPTNWTLTEPQHTLEVPSESCSPPALRHRFDVRAPGHALVPANTNERNKINMPIMKLDVVARQSKS